MRSSSALAAVAAVFAVALAPLAGRAATPITDITNAPDSFDGAQVTVVGTVGPQQVGWRGESLYTLDGEGARITVVSRGPVPAVGTHLQVDGQVRVHPEGSSEIQWPPVVVESSRTAVP